MRNSIIILSFIFLFFNNVSHSKEIFESCNQYEKYLNDMNFNPKIDNISNNCDKTEKYSMSEFEYEKFDSINIFKLKDLYSNNKFNIILYLKFDLQKENQIDSYIRKFQYTSGQSLLNEYLRNYNDYELRLKIYMYYMIIREIELFSDLYSNRLKSLKLKYAISFLEDVNIKIFRKSFEGVKCLLMIDSIRAPILNVLNSNRYRNCISK